MNIVNKVTLRHLKENKRRTLVTIFGVVISVAMITAVAALGASIIDMQQRDAISYSGDWHYAVEDVDKEQLKAIQAEENTASIGLMEELGFAPLSDQSMKRYLYVRSMDETAMKQMQVELTEGRLPRNDNEVVISEALKKEGVDYQIGDTIELDIGQRYALNEEEDRPLALDESLYEGEDGLEEELRDQEEHSFTIVGEIAEPIWEPAWAAGYTVLSYTDGLALTEFDQAYVKVNELNSTLFDDLEKLREDLGIEVTETATNTDLLDTHLISLNGGMVAALSGLLTVIIVIIMVGSIVLIYNAFAISVSERSRYLGMLSSVGATKRQKRNSVLFEGFIIGLISIPVGIGAGLLGIGITLHFISGMLAGAGFNSDIHLVVTPPIFIIAIVVSLLTIMISAWIPAVRASKITAIDAIRQAKDIKLTKKKIKTNRFVQKLFGYEAEIALKNLKRNKKRYHVTVFSLMISIILFLSVTFFTDTLTRSFELQSEEMNYDISVRDDSTDNELADFYPEIENMDNITEVNMYQQINSSAQLPEEIAGEGGIDSETTDNDLRNYTIQLIGLSPEDWGDYLRDNNISAASDENLSAVLVNNVSYRNHENKYVEAEMLDVEEGDSLPFQFEYFDEEKGDLQLAGEEELELIGLTDNFPLGEFYPSSNTLFVIVNENTFDDIMERTPASQYASLELYLTSDDANQVEEELEALEMSNGIEIRNIYEFQQQDRQLVLALSIFIYGFITLITLISIANIFNTVSTSVALRKREFATLKSIGMTPKDFNKMIRFESLFYGMKSLIYGLPISFVVMYWIHLQTRNAFEYPFQLPWLYIGIVILAVFIIVGAAMLYSTSKLKKDNIVDTLRQENI
ncbi:ABC transporter permease [Oceanobacillus jeddahense]|uniref:FtsX-like permease family protein n=1 Tax=Oceanobacillus jeddahense TaxID=1462527 RepID=A0ABY5JXM6_9BACI|nr:FtsX-like permease family protein [Oceanobacillus jeddahense]UUI04555.1 FtsX-like permease family protein [Oceanobacillus jeddahense]